MVTRVARTRRECTIVSIPCLILIHDDTPAQCHSVVTRTTNNSPSARAIASARALSFCARVARLNALFEPSPASVESARKRFKHRKLDEEPSKMSCMVSENGTRRACILVDLYKSSYRGVFCFARKSANDDEVAHEPFVRLLKVG